MSRYERRKGADFEREIADQLRRALPDSHVTRGQQGRGGRHGVPDLMVDRADTGSGWLGVECRKGKPGNVPLLPKLRQAIRDCEGTGRVPLAVVREDRGEALAVVRYADLSDLLDALLVERAPSCLCLYHEGSRLRAAFGQACDDAWPTPGLVPVGLMRVDGALVALLSWADLLGRVLVPLWAARVRGEVAA